jgi:hypothetical protein
MNRVEQPDLAPPRAEPRSSGESATRIPQGGQTPVPVRLGASTSNHRGASIGLHIGELVLHGFEPVDRYTIGGALERELTRLLSESGLPGTMTQNVDIAHMNFGVIHAKFGSKAEATGVQLARAIYGGLIK